MNYLIYLAFGQPAIRSEALFSILSYQQQPAARDTVVLVYTDAPAEFKAVLGTDASVQYPPVRLEQWQEWRGRANQPYMVKIAVLEHAAQQFPGNLLLVDTDTIWQQSPATLFARIGAGERFLHQDEGTLAAGNHLNRKIYRHLRVGSWLVLGQPFRFQPATRMYNSGLIGLRSTETGLLAEVRELAEAFFAAYNKHLMEQLAFSVVFALAGPVALADDCLLHYWNLKEARPAIVRILTTYVADGPAELLRRFTRLGLPELHRQELAYRNLPGWQRTWRKLTGRRWQLPPLTT